jgi:large subunit ribosomal protein L9
MRVILKQTLPKVGKEGTVVNVKPGFARNFLFPRQLAIVADRTQVKALEARNARLAAKLADTKADAEATAAKLAGQRLLIAVKAGEGNRLFGAITSGDLAEALKNQMGVSVDRKHIALLQPIKRLGIHRFDVDLHRLVECHMSVNVYDPEQGLPEELTPVVEEEVEDEAEEGTEE